MPRYFFHDTGPTASRDTEGTELAGPKEARSEAVMLISEVMKDADGQFWRQPDRRIEVVDENGKTVCRLRIDGWMAEG